MTQDERERAFSGEMPRPTVRFWPPGRRPEPEERIETRCAACHDRWEIHESLAGHRLRCACGAWVEVPTFDGPHLPRPVAVAALPAPEDPGPAGTLPVRRREARIARRRGRARAPDLHAPLEAGALRHGSVRDRQRWLNRVTLEIALVVGAFTGPSLAIQLLLGTEAWYRLLPVAELCAGLIVTGVALSSVHYGLSTLRAAATRYFGEGIGVGLLAAAVAVAYARLLQGHGDLFLASVRAALGLPWTLLLIAVFPAVFEEIAFRGLVQERLTVFYGREQGIVLSGIAFALAHGVTAGFPFHVALGLYLGFLRARSKSVLPGMTTHLTYNAVILLATT